MSNEIQVTVLGEANHGRWDAFLQSAADATFFHQAGWRTIIGEAVGHKTHFLMAECAGAVVGVLPLAHVNSRLFGSMLVSLPFCSYGGAVAESPEIRDRLEQEAVALARSLNVGALELRYLNGTGRDRPTKRLYETFTKPIAATEQENMHAIRGKQRNIVRKGIKSGLSCRTETLDRFYLTYAESVRNLGTPVFPKALFTSIREQFPGSTELISACLDGEPVASAMLFYFRDTVCPYYWGGTARARTLGGNDYLCWQILCRAAERGCTVFDFGRSKVGTGSFQWKLNWGFESRPLAYEYELVRYRDMPDINPLNPKYRLFIEIWKRLPLPVTLAVGPMLARNLG